MTRVISILVASTALALVLLASAREALACGCRPPCQVDPATGRCICPPPIPVYPVVACALNVGATLVEKEDGVPVRIPVGFTITNLESGGAPSSDVTWSITVTSERYGGAAAASTLQAAKGGTASSCGITGAGIGSCTATLSSPSAGMAALSPLGMANPPQPSVVEGGGMLNLECGDCSQTAMVGVSLTVRNVAGDLLCFRSACVELLACRSYWDCLVPTISTPTPVVCAQTADTVPVQFTVRRNSYPRPLIASVTPSNPYDPADLFGLFPAEVRLDFDGMRAAEQTFLVGCGTHGPCFAGVNNRLSVALRDAVTGARVLSATGFQMVDVVICETPMIRKNLVEQDGASLRYEIIARNPSLQDPLLDATITDSFPGQTVVSVQGAIKDFPMDDALGFVTPLADRLVPARVRTSGGTLRIDGFDVGLRDESNIRTLPDVIVFDVRTLADEGLLCGDVTLNAGASLEAHYEVPVGPGLPPDVVPVAAGTAGVRADCICPLGHGWWKTHHRYRTQASQELPWPLPEDATLCGRTWLDVIGDPSTGGDAFVILGRQWVAARLNVAAGAPSTPEVDAALAEGEALLLLCDITGRDRQRAILLAELLDAYNNDRSGPGNCLAGR
jgi:hypothetical protein